MGGGQNLSDREGCRELRAPEKFSVLCTKLAKPHGGGAAMRCANWFLNMSS